MEFFADFLEEAQDFFEDLFETFSSKKPKSAKVARKVKLYGRVLMVRPAYIFAERLENILKVLFGISIFVSALIASLWGFISLGDLVRLLIQSTIGRFLMIVIGVSYLILGIWKLTHIKSRI